MRDFIYEVRGTNDPVDGDRVVFTNREEAEDYASNFGNAEIYMVELELDDDNGIPTKVNEFQIKGPEVDEIVSDPDIPNSCDADNPDNYDEFGNFRYPECDDNFSDIDEGCDDRRGHDPINRRERVNIDLVDESVEDDDMTDEEFVEALYNALTTKRVEAPFPEDKLDMDPPADDVPVVKCKITPLATHSEDEKPLNEVLYYDTEAGWKEPDPRTVEITYCREAVGDNNIIDISAGFGVTFTTRSGDSIYVEANLEEAHLKYNEDYEVQGSGDAAVVTIKKPLDKIFDLRSIVPNDLDLNDVGLEPVISRIEDDSDLSYEELLDEQIEFFAKQLSLDKNIHNRVTELLENAIYNRTNFEADAMAIKEKLDTASNMDESLEESDDSELKNLDSMINKWFN